MPVVSTGMPALLSMLLACTGAATDSPSEGVDTSVTDSADTQDSGQTVPSPGRFFPDGAPWYQRVDGAPVDPSSPEKIAALQALGWGFDRFQMDFSLEVLEGDGQTPRQAVVPVSFYEPDCEVMDVPLPCLLYTSPSPRD